MIVLAVKGLRLQDPCTQTQHHSYFDFLGDQNKLVMTLVCDLILIILHRPTVCNVEKQVYGCLQLNHSPHRLVADVCKWHDTNEHVHNSAIKF